MSLNSLGFFLLLLVLFTSLISFLGTVFLTVFFAVEFQGDKHTVYLQNNVQAIVGWRLYSIVRAS